MGWGGAVHLMDDTLKAAELMVRAALDSTQTDTVPVAWPRTQVDDLLRPFVRTFAAQLRDGDWDTIEDSEYFDRFAQEMYGHGNVEHERWLIEKVIDTEAEPEWVEKLTQFRAQITAEIRAGKHREDGD